MVPTLDRIICPDAISYKYRSSRPGALATGVAADHAAALLPAALPFDLVGGRVVLGHAPGHAHAPAVPTEYDPSRKIRLLLAVTFTRRANSRFGPGPEHFLMAATSTGRMASKAVMAAGVMATTVPVLPHRSWRITVMRPLPSSQRTTSPQAARG